MQGCCGMCCWPAAMCCSQLAMRFLDDPTVRFTSTLYRFEDLLTGYTYMDPDHRSEVICLAKIMLERCDPAAGEELKSGTPAVTRPQRPLALPMMALQRPLGARGLLGARPLTAAGLGPIGHKYPQHSVFFSSTNYFTAAALRCITPVYSSDVNLRYGECPDYEDLAIAEKTQLGLGSATDANTLAEDENRDVRLDDLTFDPENEAFVALSQDEPPSSGSTPSSGLPEVPEGSTQRRNQPKRSRTQMYPDAFVKLYSNIRDKTPLEDTRHICVEEMVATFSIIVGHNDIYCNVRQRFNRSHFSTSQNFNKMLKALNTIAPDMIVKPSTAIPDKIQEIIRFMPFFKFIYVLSGWEGSTHDSKLLSDALSRRNGLQVPQGKYFLVDCGFANRCQFLAPLRGVRYHLKDFGGQGRHPRNASELFNLRHASLRNVIERIFGVFKSRFTIFKTAPPFPFQTQAELVLACAGLHNFLRKECCSDEFPVEYEKDQDLPPLDTEE
ncbi:nuclease HARBI1-like protein [Perilla frutescens var. hirtella]|nr:nuclease HARBI1-like protein [Perilla frutescens var. hirtella]